MAEYPGITINAASRTINPYRKNAYDPDFIGTSALDRGRYSKRWKGYNGFWKTYNSLKVHQRTKFIATTPNFNTTYYLTGNNLATVRRRGMYGY